MANVIEITDFTAPELDVYARLSEGQLLNRAEPEKGMFIAESPRVIERALDAGCVPVSFLSEDRHIEKEAKEILERCGEIPAYVASFDVLTQLTGYKLTRGMLCAMYRPRLRTPEEVCQGARRIAVLESVVNPTNVGAIFRSAAALNMDGILLTSDCSDPLYRRSLRVSMGTAFQIPWTYFDKQITWPMEGQAFLKEQGFQTVAMALRDDTVNIDDPGLHKKEKLAIVLGTEGEGLTSQTIASCDYTVKILSVDWDGAPLDVTDDGVSYLTLGPEANDILAGIGFSLYYVDEEDDLMLWLGTDNDMNADWENGVFYDNFRGVWGSIDGNMVFMELSDESEDYTMFSVPILLNGEEYNLQVVYDFTTEEWSILGARQGIDDTGMADKELRLLEEGDEITTIWYAATATGDDDFEAYTADTFTVTADTSFDEMELPDGSYSMVYEMRDAMDNYAYSDAVIFDCADGEIQTTVFTE